MIIDGLFTILFLFLRTIFVALPDMKLLPDSFNEAWDFMGDSLANLIWFLNPEIGILVLFIMQTIVFLWIIFFSIALFTFLWRLIRG